MYAVVKTGGKQYKVGAGDIITVEQLEGEVGSEVELSDVLMTSDGDTPEFGAPLLEGRSVKAKILAQGKGEKIIILKHRRRQRSRQKTGHRQNLTKIEILSINQG